MIHDSRIMSVKTTEKEHCPDDEQKSFVSVFERTQHGVPMHVFLQSRFEQAKKMTISKIQKYPKTVTAVCVNWVSSMENLLVGCVTKKVITPKP